MTKFKYILQSLWFYRKQNLAVMASTIISTAVLTGALIIGDSVKYTLRHRVDIRLGKSRFAMITGDRFVRTKLASELASKLNVDAAPLFVVRSVAINPDNNSRINKANVYGITDSFWKLFENEPIKIANDEVCINEIVAEKLNLKPGNEIILRVENMQTIPINTPFASSENPSVSKRFKIKAILNHLQSGTFSLKSNQAEPLNIYVADSVLQKMLDLEGISNLILLGDSKTKSIDTSIINQTFRKLCQLPDLSLKIRNIGESGKYELVSNRIFIDPKIGETLGKSASNRVLTYLVNSIRKGQKACPYSFISATTITPLHFSLKDREVVINQWLADDIQANTGDSIQISYYIIGPLRQLTEKTDSFYIRAVIPTENSKFLKSLMPEFPGMSEAGHCSDWETGVPIDLDKIRDKDETYWNEYKGSPKAFISINYGQKIWQNQFGNLTSLHFDSSQCNPEQIQKILSSQLSPQDFNLVFLPVYQQGIDATLNAVDFGQLFLSLSFFVILAGVLLTILIHIFNSRSRSFEAGLLAGLGIPKKMILLLRLTESLFIIVPAGIVGSILGIVYNYLIMAGINSVWIDVVRTHMIEVYIKNTTLGIGCISGILISFTCIWLVTRKILKQEVAIAVKKENLSDLVSKTRRNKYLGMFFLFSGLALIIYSILKSVEENSGIFLLSGALILVSFIFTLSWFFDNQKHKLKNRIFSQNLLILKNAGRNKSRSIASILLLALGTFVVIITGANRRTFSETYDSRQSGTGGYLFWAETSVPLAYNLNSQEGLIKLGFDTLELPKEVSFSQFYSLDGDDASCLNLNQVQKPRILGVSEKEFCKRGAFSFANLLPEIDQSNPWRALSSSKRPGLIHAFVDQTVLTWGLRKSVGDTLIYVNEKGEKLNIVMAGGLNNSIFQGNLLISDSLFRLNFPSSGGSRIMLVDAPGSYAKKLSDVLNQTLIDYGIELSPCSHRLAEFNSVTNTYLSVFMALGGLGMLIGTIGLGIVLLRNIQERKSELALMQAVGFTKNKLISNLLKENVFLLGTGLFIGMISAIFGILPSILSPSFEIPGFFVFFLILIVFINGFLWIYIPVHFAMKESIIETLKEE